MIKKNKARLEGRFTVLMEKELKEDFIKRCEDIGYSPSQVLRGFIKWMVIINKNDLKRWQKAVEKL